MESYNKFKYSIYNLVKMQSEKYDLLFNSSIPSIKFSKLIKYYSVTADTMYEMKANIDILRLERNANISDCNKSKAFYIKCLRTEFFFNKNLERTKTKIESCSYCKKEIYNAVTYLCSNCRTSQYCDSACQHRDWVTGHRYICKIIESKNIQDDKLKADKLLYDTTNFAVCSNNLEVDIIEIEQITNSNSYNGNDGNDEEIVDVD